MSELSRRMRELRNAANLRRLKVSGDYDGAMTVAIMRATGDVSANVAFDCKIDDVMNGPKSWESTRERAAFFVDAANEMDALCDEIERLEAENARLKLIAEHGPTLDAMGRGVGNPLDRLEDENAALRAEIEMLRLGPTKVLGMTLSEIADMRDKVDADDPKSYPPQKS